MCGRYAINFTDESSDFQEIAKEISRKYNNSKTLAQMKTGEVFPTDTVPVLTHKKTQPALMKWGFSRWDGKGVIINARAETAMEKKTFRSSLLLRRCIIPSSGFYEWTHKNVSPTLFDFANTSSPGTSMSISGGKVLKKGKYLLSIPDVPILYMAGFYNAEAEWESALPPSFVILTTAANKWVAPLHDRMPLILEEKDIADWLSDTQKAALLLSRPCETRLDVRPV